MIKMICYPKCGTCKKACKYLDDHGLIYTYRDIKEDNPSKDELKEILDRSGLEIKKLFNTSGNLYKEMELKNKVPNMSVDEALELLSTNGMLVKRPILISEDKVLVGFKESEYECLL